jgi:hypothetical protein
MRAYIVLSKRATIKDRYPKEKQVPENPALKAILLTTFFIMIFTRFIFVNIFPKIIYFRYT